MELSAGTECRTALSCWRLCRSQTGATGWLGRQKEGFYAASAGAHGVLRWHDNQGWDAQAKSVPISDIPGSYRPELLPLVLQEIETPRAVGLVALGEHKRQIGGHQQPALRLAAGLHLLAIGISDYNEYNAKNLRLNYAHRDARPRQHNHRHASGLYQVKPQLLSDKDANKVGIPGTKDDV